MTKSIIDTKAFEKSVEEILTSRGKESFNLMVKYAEDVRQECIQKTPFATGLLKRGWKLIHKKTSKGGWVEVRNDTPYASAVEYGTRPHTITATKAKVLANAKTHQFFGKTVNHPGTRPHPMLRPAVTRILPILKRKLMDL